MLAYEFTVPASKPRLFLEENLANEFGGFTFLGFGFGAWRNLNGKIELEDIARYQVAVDNLSEAERLIAFVKDHLRVIGEKAAYIVALGEAGIYPL